MADGNGKNATLLDRLRQQSSEVRANEAPRRSTEEVLVDMDQRLWRAYRWLDEALAHLSVIKPVVAHEFRIENLFTLSGLQLEQGFVSYRRRHLGGHDLLDYVETFYRLTGTQPMKVKVPPTAVATMESRLRTAGIPFRYEAQHGDFSLREIVLDPSGFLPFFLGQQRKFGENFTGHRGMDERVSTIDRLDRLHDLVRV